MEEKRLITYLLLVIWLDVCSIGIVTVTPVPIQSSSSARGAYIGQSAVNPKVDQNPTQQRKPEQVSDVEFKLSDPNSNNRTSTKQLSDLHRLLHLATKTVQEQANKFSTEVLSSVFKDDIKPKASPEDNLKPLFTRGEIDTILTNQTPATSTSSARPSEFHVTDHIRNSSAVLEAEKFNFTAACCLNLFERLIETIN